LKEKANTAYKKGEIQKAIPLYTDAITHAGAILRFLLNNLAHCCLKTHALHEAVAVATASLRIAADDKVLFRLTAALTLLGEHELANIVLEQREGKCRVLVFKRRKCLSVHASFWNSYLLARCQHRCDSMVWYASQGTSSLSAPPSLPFQH
jgi:hypothetical protein